MQDMIKRALVTGCAGFIGSHLTERLLAMGLEVVGVDNFDDFYSRAAKEGNISGCLGNGAFRFLEADLCHEDIKVLLEGVDVVFHQVAQPGVRGSWGQQFDRYVRNNILATQRLLEAAVGRPLKRLVFASSSSVYGDCPRLPAGEEALPSPLSPYGVTKLAAEHLCMLYCRSHRVPAIALRYFTVYGPRQRPDMAFARFIRAIRAGEDVIVYGDGRQTRDFTYIDDVVEANILSMHKGRPGEVLNIGGGSRISLLEVVEMMGRIMGIKPSVRHAEPQKGDVRDTWADISRARDQLGYSPTTTIKEGLRKMIAAFYMG
jgi:nucleoside-diphosphate-sugar epimerase